uniref:Uncharacterized protein n=1 Tax=viral metagenome TaxID=1070528 RepID=A0A6M3K2E0_9ZZZZ
MIKYKTDYPCECGCKKLNITSGFVGYMGSKPCYEDYGKCPECGKTLSGNEIDKRFIGEDLFYTGEN